MHMAVAFWSLFRLLCHRFLSSCSLKLDCFYIQCLQTLRSLLDIEFHSIALVKRLVAVSNNCFEVYEYIFRILAGDESETLCCIKPLDCSCFHELSFVYICPQTPRGLGCTLTFCSSLNLGTINNCTKIYCYRRKSKYSYNSCDIFDVPYRSHMPNVINTTKNIPTFHCSVKNAHIGTKYHMTGYTHCCFNNSQFIFCSLCCLRRVKDSNLCKILPRWFSKPVP
jgi:hypothetical protein